MKGEKDKFRLASNSLKCKTIGCSIISLSFLFGVVSLQWAPIIALLVGNLKWEGIVNLFMDPMMGLVEV
jgi:hypothetical protein